MRIVTFGEALFRFSARRGERLTSAMSVDFYLGGSELNVAANAVSLGAKASWVSVVSDGLSGDLILHRVGQLQVDATSVKRANGNSGWYLMEQGAHPRADVVFERSKSLMGSTLPVRFAWREILSGAKVFHSSGITAGLGQGAGDELQLAIREAREQKILVSYDFNFRRGLWSFAESIEGQKAILPYIDILFASPAELKAHFALADNALDFLTDQRETVGSDTAAIESLFEVLHKTSTNLQAVIFPRRSADEGEYGIEILTPKQWLKSRRFMVTNIDRIGIGDAMTAGLLVKVIDPSHMLNGSQGWQVAADFAAAAGAFKYTVHGDMSLCSAHEIAHLLNESYQAVRR